MEELSVSFQEGVKVVCIISFRSFRALNFVVVDGAAVDTNIAISGLMTTDTIVTAIAVNGDNTDNLSDEVSITSAGNIQFGTTATTGRKIMVVYFDKA